MKKLQISIFCFIVFFFCGIILFTNCNPIIVQDNRIDSILLKVDSLNNKIDQMLDTTNVKPQSIHINCFLDPDSTGRAISETMPIFWNIKDSINIKEIEVFVPGDTLKTVIIYDVAGKQSCEVLAGTPILLRWPENTELDLAGYQIYFGENSDNYSNVINVGNVLEKQFGPLMQTTYFCLTAYDKSGNESGKSLELKVVIK